MHKTILKITLLSLAATQAMPTHAMWSRLSQAVSRSGILRTNKPRLTAASVTGPHLQPNPTLLARTLATQQNEYTKNNNHQSSDENNSRSGHQSWWQRWRSIFTFSSIAACAGTYNSIFANEQTSAPNISEFEKFAQLFAPPEGIRRTIEAHKDKIARKSFGFFAGSNGTPDIFIKYWDVTRIINAERIRECINRNNLNHLAVPKKYIYKLDDQWIVVAEYVRKNNKREKLTLQEVQQLILVAKETGYVDWGWHLGDNIVIDKDTGKVTFIDTEAGSFGECPEIFFSCLAKFVDESAKEWLKNHNTEKKTGIDHPLPRIATYDNHNLDLTQVVDEYNTYCNVETIAFIKKYNTGMNIYLNAMKSPSRVQES